MFGDSLSACPLTGTYQPATKELSGTYSVTVHPSPRYGAPDNVVGANDNVLLPKPPSTIKGDAAIADRDYEVLHPRQEGPVGLDGQRPPVEHDIVVTSSAPRVDLDGTRTEPSGPQPMTVIHRFDGRYVASSDSFEVFMVLAEGKFPIGCRFKCTPALFVLTDIEVERSYPWKTDCEKPGTEHLGPGQTEFSFGWDGTFNSGLETDDLGAIGHAGVNKLAATLTLQAPVTISPGSTVQFGASVHASWNNRGYGFPIDRTITIIGDAGSASKKLERTGKINGEFASDVSATKQFVLARDPNLDELNETAIVEVNRSSERARLRITLHYAR